MSTARRLLLAEISILLAALLVASPAFASPAADARAAAAEKRWNDAAEAWLLVLEKKAADREAALGLATAVIEGNLVDYQVQAEEALQAALEKKKDDRDLQLALGNLFIASARSKTDQQAMKFVFEDAKSQFQRMLDAHPDDEDAAVGLARTHYWTGYFADAIQVLDDFMAKSKSKGPALYWKGQVYYLQALDAYRASGKIDEAAQTLFRQAKGAYEAAATAAPDMMDAWMQMGYAAQYLGSVEEGQQAEAQKAYEKAMDLDPDSLMPLKGIEALYYYRQDQYLPALAELARTHPKNNAVYYFMGFRQYYDKDYAQAVKSLQTFVQRSKTPAVAWTLLGQALDGAGKTDEAEEVYLKALKANPSDEMAAGALDARLRQEYQRKAGMSVSAAKACIDAYNKLFAMAPTAPWPRNNCAFILREAVGAHRDDASWKPILDECVRIYVEGSKLVEMQIAGREDQLTQEQRWAYAGVINDTGLMFQYYPSVLDLEKAEEYYLRSLELTADGYVDAFTNLVKLYQDQGRFQEAYELARDCSESLTNPDGSPSQARNLARRVMDELAKSGKVETD